VYHPQGACIDGGLGYILNDRLKTTLTIIFTLWLIGQPLVQWETLQIRTGRWVRAPGYRRPLFCAFNATWDRFRYLGTGRKTCMVEEFLQACGLVRLATTSLCGAVMARITASDATETGGGTTAATGLTTAGWDLLRSAGPSSKSPTRLPLPWPDVAAGTPALPARGGLAAIQPCRALIVGLRGGSGAACVGAHRAGVCMVGQVHCELTYSSAAISACAAGARASLTRGGAGAGWARATRDPG